MPRSQQARFSFTSGVMSPRLSMRADGDKYASASRIMDNFMVSPQGGALFRSGMEHIGFPNDLAEPCRLFSFRDGGDISDTLFEVNAGLNRYWRDDVLLDPPTTPDIFEATTINPFLPTDLPTLGFCNQESLAIITSPNHPPQYVGVTEQGVVGEGSIDQVDVPRSRFFDYKSPRFTGTDSLYTVDFGGSPWVTNNLFWFYYDEVPTKSGTQITPTYFHYSSVPAEMITTLTACFSRVKILAGATINVAQAGTDIYTVQVISDKAGRPARISALTNEEFVAPITLAEGDESYVEEPAWSYPYTVLHNGVYYICVYPHNSQDGSDSEPGVGVSWQSYWESIGATPPAWWEWQHGSDNSWAVNTQFAPWDRGFPSVAEFHEQRLVFAGSKDAPTRIWASRIGEYNDFDTGPNDTDPIEFSIQTSDTPAIKWMSSTSQGLLLGTSSGEFIISAQVTLSPTDIQSQRQNSARSNTSRAEKVGQFMFYIEQGKSKLRASQYSRTIQGYDSEDVSSIAEHLLAGGINRIEMMRMPDSIMFAHTASQQLLCVALEPNQGLFAWSEMHTTGDVYDLATIYSVTENEDAVYVCVLRGAVYSIEKMKYPRRTFGADLSNAIHLDSWATGTLTNSQTITLGRSNLDNQTVRVTIDDADIGTFPVVGGTVDLVVPRTGRYAVGLPYTGTIRTWEQAGGNPAGVGFGTARRWNKLYTRLLDSGIPKINGQLPADRTPASLMDLPEPLRTYDARIHNAGFGDGSIEIIQDLPYPTHILGVYGEFGVNNV